MVVSRNSPELESLPELSLTWSLSFVALDSTQGIAVVFAVVLHPHSDFWFGGGVFSGQIFSIGGSNLGWILKELCV